MECDKMKKSELRQLIKEEIRKLNEENLNFQIIEKFMKKESQFLKYFKKNKYKKYDIKAAIYDFGYKINIDFDEYSNELDYLGDTIIIS